MSAGTGLAQDRPTIFWNVLVRHFWNMHEEPESGFIVFKESETPPNQNPKHLSDNLDNACSFVKSSTSVFGTDDCRADDVSGSENTSSAWKFRVGPPAGLEICSRFNLQVKTSEGSMVEIWNLNTTIVVPYPRIPNILPK
jgi:hypothetical protein